MSATTTTTTTLPENTFGRIFVTPPNHNITGTCGKCGGPVVQPMLWAGGEAPPEVCTNCGARPKKQFSTTWGPIREMENI